MNQVEALEWRISFLEKMLLAEIQSKYRLETRVFRLERALCGEAKEKYTENYKCDPEGVGK